MLLSKVFVRNKEISLQTDDSERAFVVHCVDEVEEDLWFDGDESVMPYKDLVNEVGEAEILAEPENYYLATKKGTKFLYAD